MGPLQTILFPTDFSPVATEVIPYINEMAQRFRAKLTVLHAFDLVHDYILVPPLEGTCETGRIAIPYTPAFEELREERQRQLQEFARNQFPNVSYATRIEDGDPARVIELVAQRQHVDLIVMPTKGLGRFRRLLLGSVTAKVLHDISYPVLTSAHEPDFPLVPATGYRSIMCAVELNREMDTVLKAAGFLAHAYGARLCLVHIESSPSREHDKKTTVESVRRRFQQAWNANDSETGMDTKVCVLDDGVPEGIRSTAIQEKADLLVVGRGRKRGNFSQMWSHLYTIIRESPCPVLSV